MIQLSLKRNYQLIGRILYKTRPEVATELEEMVAPGTENNLQRIFFYFSRFDSIELRNYNEVNKRRLFIAAMIFLYYPNTLKNGIINVKKGFCTKIAACFNCKKEGVTRNIREVIIMYRAYEEFGEKVNEIIESFKNNN